MTLGLSIGDVLFDVGVRVEGRIGFMSQVHLPMV